MHRITGWDWLGAFGIWFVASFGVGAMLDTAGAPDEGVVMIAGTMFFGGLVAARVWWLRRGDDPRGVKDGLTTGEMTAQRLAEMEARLLELEAAQERVFELEERLELAERLLAQGRDPARLARERTPI